MMTAVCQRVNAPLEWGCLCQIQSDPSWITTTTVCGPSQPASRRWAQTRGKSASASPKHVTSTRLTGV
jgi:hypothetical protein